MATIENWFFMFPPQPSRLSILHINIFMLFSPERKTQPIICEASGCNSSGRWARMHSSRFAERWHSHPNTPHQCQCLSRSVSDPCLPPFLRLHSLVQTTITAVQTTHWIAPTRHDFPIRNLQCQHSRTSENPFQPDCQYFRPCDQIALNRICSYSRPGAGWVPRCVWCCCGLVCFWNSSSYEESSRTTSS